MNTICKYALILVIIVVYSCKRDQTIEFSSFPKTFELKGTKVKDELYFKGGAVDIFDSLLIISSTPEKTECIHLFNKNSFKHILSTGRIGGGPGEITNMGLGCIDKTKGIIWYRDLGRKILWEFKIEEVLSKPDFLPVNYLPLPKEKFFIQFFPEENNLFSYANPDQDVLISFFNHKGELLDSLNIPDQLNVYDKLNEDTRMYTSTYLYRKHPLKKLYVIAYRMADVVAVISSQGHIISKTLGPGKVMENPRYGENNYVETNEHIVVSDKLIYCLYLGVKNLEMTEGEISVNHPKELHIYDWKGEPVAKIDLEYSATTFDIDFEKNRMITFSPETGGIVYYNLSQF
jgi:hypothetical protein